MTVSHKLITLGLAFGLLGSTCAFARPTPYVEHGRLSYENKTVTTHAPATSTSGATGYARPPSANTVKDDWPSEMLLG